ncbi:PhnA domain-containing protein [Halovibrio variabilis]
MFIRTKDLRVKSSSLVIKQLKEGKDHHLELKVDGSGDMIFKAQFVKKV